MKKYILFIICLLAVTAFIVIPDMQPDFCSTDSLLSLAAGPIFAPLKWPSGQNNMGGFKSCVLFIPYDAATAVPLISDKPATAEDLVKAVGTFAFAAAGTYKEPIYLYSTEGTVEYKAEPQGEADGISYKQTAALFFPGNTPGMHAFNAMVKNTRGYLVLEDSDGQQILMGKPGMYVSVSPSFSGGKGRNDRRGTAYTATCDANESAVILATPIDMEIAGGLKPKV